MVTTIGDVLGYLSRNERAQRVLAGLCDGNLDWNLIPGASGEVAWLLATGLVEPATKDHDLCATDLGHTVLRML